MSDVYAISIGPIPTGQGYGTIFIGLHEGRLIPLRSTNDAEGALVDLRSKAPSGSTLRCLPELAVAGEKYGFLPTPPSEEVLAFRGQLALVLAHVDIEPKCSLELFPLMQAAAAFWAAQVWEKMPADLPIAVTISGSLSGTFEAAVMGAAGQEYGLALYPKPGSIAKLTRIVDSGRLDSARMIETFSLTCDDGPGFAVRAIEAWCGLPMLPRVYGLRRGRPRAIDKDDALILATTLRAMTQMEGIPGEVASSTIESPDVLVTSTVRLPELALVPPPKGRKPTRRR